MNPTQVTVSGGSLFDLAAEHLGCATQWYRIAQVNGLPPDPVISVATPITLIIPAPDPSGGNGGIFYQ
jgi:hypothetical protein